MSDFKWGTWYPIETLPKKCPEIITIWVPLRNMSFQVSTNCVSDYGEGDLYFWSNEHSGQAATHWMPSPPSPEEMEKMPSVERGIRRRLDFLRNVPPGLIGPKFAVRELLREELEKILREAGLK